MTAARGSQGQAEIWSAGSEAPIHSPQDSSQRSDFMIGVQPAKDYGVSGRPHHRPSSRPHPPRKAETRANPTAPATERQQPWPAANPQLTPFSRHQSVPRTPTTFDHFDAVDVAFDGAGAVGDGEPSGDGGPVPAEPLCEPA